MNNLVVQLLLKTGTFSTDLKTARGQIQNFQQGCQNAGKSLTAFGNSMGINIGALSKFGGAVGAAVLAGKELKAIIDSNQTSADAFQGVIAGCTGVISTFNQAIATADFSAFRDGLWSVFEAAKSARDALDALNDASLAYGFLSKENRTKFMEETNIIRDPHATPEEKEAAKSRAREIVDVEYDFAEKLGEKQMKAYRASIIKEAGKANIQEKDITGSQFREAMNIKLGTSTQTEEDIDRKYNEYTSKLKEYGKNNITAQNELKKRYADVIAVRAMIKGMNDDELKQVVTIVSAQEDAKQNAESMKKTLNRLENVSTTPKGGGSGGSKTLKEEIPIQEESLDYWKKLAQEAEKHRNAEVFNSEGWIKYNNELKNALKQIEEINLQTKVAEQRQKMDELGKLPELPKIEAKVETDDITTGLNGQKKEIKYTATELENLIKLYTEWKNELKEGDPLLAKYNQKIKEYGDRLNTINSTGLPDPSIKKDTVDSWETFNQAMSNTSTIVSSLTNTFKEGNKITAASFLQMVSTALPALGSLISSVEALTAAEAAEAGVAATAKAVSTSKHWIEAIAAVAALGSVVAAAIAAAKTTKKYANGGIVGGTSYSGDRLVARVNSGEMILNKSQQANLFRMANGSSSTGGQVEFHISGTDLVGVLNNNIRKNRIIR